MTYVKGKILVLQTEKPDKCELCGEERELRPYGPGGKRICFQCAMENEEETEKNFLKTLGGVDNIISLDNTN